MSKFDQQLFEYFQIADRKRLVQPLVLGGVAGSGGGTGYPPGGFVGYLPQTQVAYDLSEASSSTGSTSLLDNLNHIRYRIEGLEDWVEISGFVPISFTELNDTPDVYMGQAGKAVIVNLTENALEFEDVSALFSGSIPLDFTDLNDTPSSYTGQAEKFVVVNLDEDALEFIDIGSLSGIGIDTFVELNDTPDSYIGNANKIVTVNSLETGLEFINPSGVFTFTELGDTPDSYEGQARRAVVVSDDETDLEFYDIMPFLGSGISTFLELTDTPSVYTNNANKVVVVNDTENALEFEDKSLTGERITLFNGGGLPLVEYPATYSGLVNASTDATPGDKILIPIITISGNFTFTSFVTYEGISRDYSIIAGRVDLSQETRVVNLKIERNGSFEESGSERSVVRGTNVGICYMDNCIINLRNTSTDWTYNYGFIAQDGEAILTNCKITSLASLGFGVVSWERVTINGGKVRGNYCSVADGEYL